MFQNIIISEDGETSVNSEVSEKIVAGRSLISLEKLETRVYSIYIKGQSKTYSPIKVVKE